MDRIIKKKLETINLMESELNKIKKDIHNNKLGKLTIGKYYNNYLNFYIDLYKIRIKLRYSMNKAAEYLGTTYSIIYSRLRVLKWEDKEIQINENVISEELKNVTLTEEEKNYIKVIIKNHNLRNINRKGSRDYSNSLELYTDIFKMRYKLNYPVEKMDKYIYGNSHAYNIQKKLSKVGWAYSRNEAQQLASQYSRDYKEIRLKAKRTALSNYYEMEGSNQEKYTREKLNIELTSNFPNLEIIVGINNISILNGDEIDIPIIIIDKKNIYKIGVEVSGEYWHKKDSIIKKDNEKMEKAFWKNYNMFIIRIVESSRKQSEQYGSIDKQIQEIIDNIKNKILER